MTFDSQPSPKSIAGMGKVLFDSCSTGPYFPVHNHCNFQWYEAFVMLRSMVNENRTYISNCWFLGYDYTNQGKEKWHHKWCPGNISSNEVVIYAWHWLVDTNYPDFQKSYNRPEYCSYHVDSVSCHLHRSTNEVWHWTIPCSDQVCQSNNSQMKGYL